MLLFFNRSENLECTKVFFLKLSAIEIHCKFLKLYNKSRRSVVIHLGPTSSPGKSPGDEVDLGQIPRETVSFVFPRVLMFSLLSLGGSAFWDHWTTPFAPSWKVTKKS